MILIGCLTVARIRGRPIHDSDELDHAQNSDSCHFNHCMNDAVLLLCQSGTSRARNKYRHCLFDDLELQMIDEFTNVIQ